MPGVVVPAMREKKEPLESIMKGLQIASTVYGIKEAMANSDAREEKRLEEQGEKMAALKTKQEKERGVMTPLEALAAQKDNEVVPNGTPGAIQAFVRDETGKETPLFLKARGKEAGKKTALTSADTLRGGKKGKLTKYSDGSEDFIEAPPDAPAADKSNEHAMALRKEYNSHPTTQDTSKIVSAHSKVSKAANNAKPNAATDMSLVFGYMKLLDPGSAVKEGEYATAEQAKGVPDWVVGLYNKAKDGQILTPDQRAAFGAEADTILEGQLALQAEQDARYEDLARQYKVDPATVIDRTFGKSSGALTDKRKKQPETLTTAPKAPAPPAVGEERNGYVFKGGDPADKSRWVERTTPSVGTATSILERK